MRFYVKGLRVYTKDSRPALDPTQCGSDEVKANAYLFAASYDLAESMREILDCDHPDATAEHCPCSYFADQNTCRHTRARQILRESVPPSPHKLSCNARAGLACVCGAA